MHIMHRIILLIRVQMADVTVGNQAGLAREDVRYLVKIVIRVLETRPFTGCIGWFRREMDDGNACKMRL